MHILSNAITTFADRHDDLPAFHAGYLVLTVLAAAMLNMGAFGTLILIHMVLDYIKYHEVHGRSIRLTLEGMLRESLLDMTLFLVGLVFSLYFHHSTALLGVSGLMRAELTVVRATGTILPKLTILHHFLKVMAHLQHYLHNSKEEIQKPLSGTEKFCMLSVVLCLALLVFAQKILSVDQDIINLILLEELIPFRI